MTSARAMSLFLYLKEKMNEETSLMKWQEEKEKTNELKKQIIEIIQWELKEDLRESMEEEDD